MVSAYRSNDLADKAVDLVVAVVNQIEVDDSSISNLFFKAIDVIENDEISNKLAYLVTSVKKGALTNA